MPGVTRSVWQSRKAAREACDVCIVGAGILGASTAWWLGKLAPRLRVVVVDARWPAYGASGRNAGFLLQGAVTDYVSDIRLYGIDRARALRTFTHENRDQLLAEIPTESFGFVPSGSLTVAGETEEEERLRESAALMDRDGFPAELLGASAVNTRLGSKDYRSGLLVPTGGMLNPAELVGQLIARSGATSHTHRPVLHVDADAVEGGDFRIAAGTVVVCAGPWTAELLPEAARFVRPVRAQMMALEPARPMTLDLPIYSHEGFYYLRPDPRGRILVGGARHLHREVEVGFRDATTPALQADLLDYARRHFPELARARKVTAWAGTMGFSPDGLPFVGRVPSGAYLATGFTGHGMAYGFRSGRLLANLVTGTEDPFAALFDPERPTAAASQCASD
ncbi:MAG: FAD-binding oxidoreductase [Rhodothermales bacterium]|nr:FAD-binding oxidoreductase [Rhodothermales bacterium]